MVSPLEIRPASLPPAAVRIRAAAILLLASAGGGWANTRFTLPETISVRSISGQFIVYGLPRHAPAALPSLANRPDYLNVDPAVTAVACERIKSAWSEALGDSSPWRGNIDVVAQPAWSANDEVTLVAGRFRDGWRYRLEVPSPVERTRFARAVVQALLVERAGRNARDHAPEIPEWLASGLTQQLLLSSESGLLPQPPRRAAGGLLLNSTVVSVRPQDPLAAARQTLREQPALTLAELSWPDPEHLNGSAREVYRSSAQLFVVELLRLKDGRACLRGMLEELPGCYNWQTAFFRAFQSHFVRQVDLEKWWALQVVHFTGRDPSKTWPVAESWRKLDEALRTPVEIRRARNELPERAALSLTEVLREFDSKRQSQALRARLRDLDLLRLRVSPELVALVDDYRRVLTHHLEQPARAGEIPAARQPAAGASVAARATIQQLAALEARREQLKPRAASADPEESPALQPRSTADSFPP